jgi:DNA polymerase III subunit alpha, Gram-positive type
MSDHASDKVERFQHLLQQLELTEDAVVVHFHHAQIEKVVVEKKARKWHFFFLFEKIVPCSVYGRFTTQLEKVFAPIASVSYSVSVSDQQFSDDLLIDYWKNCIREIDGIAPPLLKLLDEQIPKIQGNKLILSVRNETEGLALKRKYEGIIANIYQSFGFPLLAIETEIQSTEKNEEYEQFLLAKQKEDQERGLLALIEMQKKDAEQNQAGGDSEGPLTIGLTIKGDADFRSLIDITDEERRIAVEGYIFHAETKELRSGRTLLTFKVTDYTSSIMVKMFSRDKEDASLYNA